VRLKLRMEPRPISTWGITLASRLDRKEWDGIRQKVYKDAGYKCEICGSGDSQLHCHEKWSFDDRKRIQRLVGFECLCRKCHDVKHFGRSQEVYGKEYVEKLKEHWCKVNKKGMVDFRRHEAEIHQISRKRVDRQYIVKVGRRILV